MYREEVDRLGESILSCEEVEVKPAPEQIQAYFSLDSFESKARDILDYTFRIYERKTTVKKEVFCGFLHYVSCLYILTVIPKQLSNAGYSAKTVFLATTITTGLGSIAAGILSNLPFIIAPATCISIFLSVFLQEHAGSGNAVGNAALFISGCCLILLGIKSVNRFITKYIPLPIQVGAVVGIGLITAMAGSTELSLIVDGPTSSTLLELGTIDSQIYIAGTAFIIIVIGIHYHVKGSFCIALAFGAILYWGVSDTWPQQVAAAWPKVSWFHFEGLDEDKWETVMKLTFDLFFLYVLFLNGLVHSLATLSSLVNENGDVPGGSVLYLICGLMTVFSAFLGGAPVVVSPESAAAIKAGAKTGLSSVVAGILFLLTTWFEPLFTSIPSAGTSPILLAIGVVLFQNVLRLDWHIMKEAAPAFICLFYIPMTYSVLDGLVMGYIVYITIEIFTEDVTGGIKYLLTFNDTPHMTAKDELNERFGIRESSHSSGSIRTYDTAFDMRLGLGSNPVSSVSGADTGYSTTSSSATKKRHLPSRRNQGIVINLGYPELVDDQRIQRRPPSLHMRPSLQSRSVGSVGPGPGPGLGDHIPDLGINHSVDSRASPYSTQTPKSHAYPKDFVVGEADDCNPSHSFYGNGLVGMAVQLWNWMGASSGAKSKGDESSSTTKGSKL